MVFPGGHFTVLVDGRFQIVPSSGSIKIVLHVVFTSPLELNRSIEFTRDPGRFYHKVRGESSSETTAKASHIYMDTILGDPQSL